MKVIILSFATESIDNWLPPKTLMYNTTCFRALFLNFLLVGSIFAFSVSPLAAQSTSCEPGLGGSIGLSPSGQPVHIGDIITINALTMFNGPNTCPVTNFTGWLIGPDGSTNLAMQNVSLPAGPLAGGQASFFACNGSGGGAAGAGASGNCIPFQTNWVVQFSDIGRNLTFATNVGGLFVCDFSGIAKHIQFEFTGFGNIPGSSSQARACQNVAIPVIFPCISITKECDYPVGSNCFTYGSPIYFKGQVCNSGDTRLANISVIDTPTGPTSSNSPIVFAATTSSGRAFDGSLTNGECVNYSGFYIPSGNLCGPFSDSVVAFGTDMTGLTVASTNACIDPNTGVSTGPRPPATATCDICTSPAITVTKFCPETNGIPGGVLGFSGSVSNAGNVPLTNVTVIDDLPLVGGGTLVTNIPLLEIGESRAFSAAVFVPTNICSLTNTLTARGTNICTALDVVAVASANCPIQSTPRLSLTKACPPTNAIPGSLLVYTGTITNVGDIAITNIVLSDAIFGTNTTAPVPSLIARLEPGEGMSFTGSYLVPTNLCSITDTIEAIGRDVCGTLVSTNVSANCIISNTPGLRLTKLCPPTPPGTGELLVFTGTVTNIGNIAVTNIVIVNDQPTNNTPVTIVGRLEPGQGTSFSGSYRVPTNACSLTDTLTASGTDVCGTAIATNVTRTCAVTNSPRITVTKLCPPEPVSPGGIAVISGVVSNAGNVTLTNVIVVDNRPTNNTVLLGPITLLPGQTAPYTGSFLVPSNCCTYVDTVTATGADACFGRVVAATATAVCPTITSPGLSIIKRCPPLPVAFGETLFFSGTVSNSGNITLTNVIVVNNKPTNNTPVLGPITLAPGETADFSGSYVVPMNSCETNIADIVTASGNGLCNGEQTSASDSQQCPIAPRPALVVTKNCPANPVPPGGVLQFSGIVSNAGNVTLTNVIVVNNRPTNNTPVLGPVTLVPGQFIGFSGSYPVCTLCCPPYVDTLRATGAQICNGSNIAATATAYCPGTNSPRVSLAVECPVLPVAQGQPFLYSGIVSNSGNVTVGNILISDDQIGFITEISALAPGETASFLGEYVPTNCGPNVIRFITAVARDVCSGNLLTNQIGAACAIACPPSQGPLLVSPSIVGGQFRFFFQTEEGKSYTVETTLSLLPTSWQPLTNFIGDGTQAIIFDVGTNGQKYYRVLVQ